MSMGSIGSLRGALGSAETQPSFTTLRMHARDRAASALTDAPEGAQSVEASGSSGIAPGAAPWSPWPPYMPPPPPPEQPVASKPVVSPLPPPPVEKGPGDDLTVKFLPTDRKSVV